MTVEKCQGGSTTDVLFAVGTGRCDCLAGAALIRPAEAPVQAVLS